MTLDLPTIRMVKILVMNMLLLVLLSELGSSLGMPPPPSYEERYFDQDLDHFNFATTPLTFRQRYLFIDKYWGAKPPRLDGCKGPIFFYTGNESPVTTYYEGSGYWTQVLGPFYGALIIFAEHRYFGVSMPFGDKSFDPGNIDYLSSEQALADYAVLLTWLKENIAGAKSCPVIAWGGSYGGMLTTWFRLKYPHLTIGGLAASAPFAFYGTGVSPFAFTEAASNTYEEAFPGCSITISNCFALLQKLATSVSGRTQFAKSFMMCDGQLQNETQAYDVINWIAAGLSGMAMLDYPYPTNYGIPLPGWPVNKTCSRLMNFGMDHKIRIKSRIVNSKRRPIHINHHTDDVQGLTSSRSNVLYNDAAAADDVSDVLDAFAYAIGVFYNSTGSVKCYDIAKNVPDWGKCCGWDYLACTSTYLPSASNGMFPFSDYNLTADSESCKTRFGVDIRPNWGRVEFAGFDLSSASNIIFSNGLLDPWHTSGILKSINENLIAIVIPAAAHHLDLREPNPEDPVYVQEARKSENQTIFRWLEDYYRKH